jgi:hypothetical protein
MAEILTLDAYLAATMKQSFAWGNADCCTFFSGWVQAVTGVDPHAFARGRYGTEAEAYAFVGARGGLRQAVEDEMRRLMFEQTTDPRTGDVGLVLMPIVGETAAIRSGTVWIMRRPRGLVGVPAPALVAWTVA